MIEGIFIELSIIVVVALIVTGIMRWLRQPTIVGYILTGIIVGPLAFNLISSWESFEPLAKIGISLLLFTVGLNLNPKAVKKLGKVVIITGIGQLVFTFVTGYIAATLFGFSSIASVYIALALSFSSTIVVLHFLSDREETETVHGRIAIGFLIVQDMVHILAIIVLMTATSIPAGTSIVSVTLYTILKVAALGVGLFVASVFVLPHITKRIARSQEMLLFFAIGWALALSALFYYLNLSTEVGALLAGVALSMSPYKYEISSKLKPLREFFLLIFFIWLAFLMSPISIGENIGPIVAFSLIVLVGTPLVVLIIMGRMGYTKRNSFLAGITVAQVSEFSFIIAVLGVSMGHIPASVLSLIVIVGLVTIAGSSYGMTHSRSLYNFFAGSLSIFERKDKKVDEGKYHVREDYDAILFGYNRIGFDLLKAFGKIKKRVLVVDFNPDTIQKLAKKGIDARYGDATDIELLDDLNFKHVKMVVSTIPDTEISLMLVRKLRRINKRAIFIFIAHNVDEALELYNAGATYVIMPHFLGGQHTAELIKKHGLKMSSFQAEKTKSRKELMGRKREGHEHPRHERG